MDSDDDVEMQSTPPTIIEAASSAANNLIPEKSKDRYEFVYKKFINWRNEHQTSSLSENVLLAYFGNVSQNLKPSTLWSMYSMLRSTIQLKHNVDISKYPKLNAYLKKQSKGFRSKKAKVLTSEQIQTFLQEAADEKFLFTKVALIFGIAGACRSRELTDLEVDNIQDLGNSFLVTIPNTKTNVPRSFSIVGVYYNMVKKYIALRPLGINAKICRFFLNYQNGRCTKQVIGINKLGNVPKQIATFLKLPEPQLYTGHSLRRSSTTVLANTGANLVEIKQHGGWKSSMVAEQYIEDSVTNKINRGMKIFQSLENSEKVLVTNKINRGVKIFPSLENSEEVAGPSCEGAATKRDDEGANTINNYYNCNFYFNKTD